MSGHDPRYTQRGRLPGGSRIPLVPPQFALQQLPVNQPGKGKAVAALVLGILSIPWSGAPFLGLIVGIIGIILAVSARKKDGYTGALRSACFALPIIGIALSTALTACQLALGTWADFFSFFTV